MTEEDALTKWCPFARVHSNGTVANRDNPEDALITEIDGVSRCLGSACMAWRWSEVMLTQGQHVPMPQGSPEGYCGLAGRPSQL